MTASSRRLLLSFVGQDGSSGTSGDGADGGGGSQRTLYALSDGQVRAMAEKLSSMEQRLNSLQSLDELEKRASAGGTPLSDMWNFTQLNQRLEAAEQGLSKVFDEDCTTGVRFQGAGWVDLKIVRVSVFPSTHLVSKAI